MRFICSSIFFFVCAASSLSATWFNIRLKSSQQQLILKLFPKIVIDGLSLHFEQRMRSNLRLIAFILTKSINLPVWLDITKVSVFP